MSLAIEYVVQLVQWDNFTCVFDYDGSNNCIYMGRASIGSSTSSASWQIVRFTYNGSNNCTNKEWADHGSFSNVWTTRASVPSYS